MVRLNPETIYWKLPATMGRRGKRQQHHTKAPMSEAANRTAESDAGAHKPFEAATTSVRMSDPTMSDKTALRGPSRLDRWRFGFEVATFLAVAAYAVIAFCQTRIIARQFADADRPWVGLNQIDALSIKRNEKGAVDLILLNSGKSPAFDVTTVFHATVERSGIPLGPPDDSSAPVSSTPTGRLPIFPNQTYRIPAATGGSVTDTDYDGITNGPFSFVVWGTVEYEDTHHIHHTTKVCAYYNVKVIAGLTPCANGNTAD